MSSQLPAELYREIILHVRGRAALVPLLTVSRLLNYEAERVLYRRLSIEMDPLRGLLPQDAIHCTEFPHFKRVGHHVRSINFSGVCGATVHDFLIPMLLSLTNIKALTLKFAPSSKRTSFLCFLPEKVPFDLLQFTIYNHRGDDGLASFLRSQSSIIDLSWTPDTLNPVHIPLSLSDLPHLTSFSSGPSVIRSILPGRNIRLLDCRTGSLLLTDYFEPGISFHSVRELVLPIVRDPARISSHFPNVQYLVTNHDETLFSKLNLFEHLKRLKLITKGLTIPGSHPKVASKLFTCHNGITLVELAPAVSGILSKFERGFEKDVSLASVEFLEGTGSHNL